MKALYMDTEQVSATNQLVEQKIEEIREELKDSKRSFRKMDWQSPTRDQMQGEFERVITQMNCLLDQGENLCQRLQREVQEWEAAGLHYLSVQGNAANPALSTESVWSFLTAGVGMLVAQAERIGGWVGDRIPVAWFDGNRPVEDQNDYLINQFSKHLIGTEAGRKFIEKAKNAGLGFRLPDGSVIGAPSGRIVPVMIGAVSSDTALAISTNDGNNDRIANDPQITISEEWLKKTVLVDKDYAGAVLGHEMQHQLDDVNGLMDYYEHMEQHNGNETDLETYLSHCVQTRVQTELNAWKLGSEIDPGSMTEMTAGTLLANGYDEHYENEISNLPDIAGKYHVHVFLGSNGKAQVELTSLERVNGK